MRVVITAATEIREAAGADYDYVVASDVPHWDTQKPSQGSKAPLLYHRNLTVAQHDELMDRAAEALEFGFIELDGGNRGKPANVRTNLLALLASQVDTEPDTEPAPKGKGK